MALGLWLYVFNRESGFYSLDVDEWVIVCLVSILCMSVGALTGLGIAFTLPMDTEEQIDSYNLESLGDNSTLNGSFFLGCGNVNSKMTYTYYMEQDGYYTLESVPCDITKIKYSSDRPMIHKYSEVPTDSWVNLFAADNLTDTECYLIEIPKGSINNSYNLDTK